MQTIMRILVFSREKESDVEGRIDEAIGCILPVRNKPVMDNITKEVVRGDKELYESLRNHRSDIVVIEGSETKLDVDDAKAVICTRAITKTPILYVARQDSLVKNLPEEFPELYYFSNDEIGMKLFFFEMGYLIGKIDRKNKK